MLSWLVIKNKIPSSLIVCLIILGVVVTSLMPVLPARAEDNSLDTINQKHYAGEIIAGCIEVKKTKGKTEELKRFSNLETTNSPFFDVPGTNDYVHIGGLAEKVQCDSAYSHLSILGYSNIEDFLVKNGYEKTVSRQKTNCRFIIVSPESPAQEVCDSIKDVSIYSNANPTFSDLSSKRINQTSAAKYLAYYKLLARCKLEPSQSSGNPDITVKTIEEEPVGSKKFTIKDSGLFLSDPNASLDSKIFETLENHRNNKQSCRDLVGKINENAEAYLTWSNHNGENPAKKTDPSSRDNETKTCGTEVSGIGWLMCPITTAGIAFADTIWKVFEGLLSSDPLKESGGADRGAYFNTWRTLVNIANVLLVVAFLIIIFSQTSNLGISNYGIKKMLPRLIIAAVAANLSFYIVQIAIDIANTLGAIIMHAITESAQPAEPSWSGLMDLLLGVGVGGTLTFFASPLLPSMVMPLIILLAIFLLIAIIGLVAGFIALTVRSALIPIVAILAPIAFVAYAFPNGQTVFNYWRKTFTALLVLYPLASIYFGALKFAAGMMVGSNDIFDRMIGHTLLFFGCFVVAGIAIKGNAITGKVFGAVNGSLRKLTAPIEKAGMLAAGGAAALGLSRLKNQTTTGKLGGIRNAPSRWLGKGLNTFDRSRWMREHGKSVARADQDEGFREWAQGDGSEKFRRVSGISEDSAAGKAYMDNLTATAVKNAEAKISSSSIRELEETLKRAINSGDTVGAMAAQNRLLSSGPKGLESFNNAIEANPNMNGGMYGVLSSNLRNSHAAVMIQDNVTQAWATADIQAGSSYSWSDASSKAASDLSDKGMSPDKFANLTEAAQARILGNETTASSLSTETLSALSDISNPVSSKLTDANRKMVNNQLNQRRSTGGDNSQATPNLTATRPVSATESSPTTDSSGRQTPGSVTDPTDYHEDMNK